MIENVINKIIIENKPKEYELLANTILTSPISIYPYAKVQEELEKIAKFNKNKLKDDKYAIFYNLKTVSIGKKNYRLPSLEILILFLNKNHDKAMTSILLAEALDQIILHFLLQDKK